MSTDTGDAPSTTRSATELRHVIRGFGGLAASSLISQLIGFIALAYVARRTGASNLGAYTVAFLLATYFNLFCSLGIDYLATRDLAQDRSQVNTVVGETLALQGVLSAVVYGALLLLAPLLAPTREAQQMVPILGLVLFTGTFTVDWALLALGRSDAVALWRLIGQVAYAAFVPVLVVSGRTGAFHYAWLNVLGLAVTSIGLFWALRRAVRMRLRVRSLRVLLLRLRRSIPFGYSLVMTQIYGTVGMLMLGYLDSTHAVGVYSVASKLPWALVGFANIWLNVFFPHTARRLVDDVSGFARDLGHVVNATLVIAAAVTVGASLCAGTLMTAMFGSAFHAAATPFALLAGAGSLVLLQASFSNVLLAGGSQKYFVVAMTVAATSIVALNLIFIPAFGAVGAAITTVVGEIGLTSMTFVGVRRRVGPVHLDVARLARGSAAVAAMAVATVGARLVGGAAVQVAVAAVSFGAAAWIFAAFDPALMRR
jgi:O-antigen/teichoic acid export membrane protein